MRLLLYGFVLVCYTATDGCFGYSLGSWCAIRTSVDLCCRCPARWDIEVADRFHEAVFVACCRFASDVQVGLVCEEVMNDLRQHST